MTKFSLKKKLLPSLMAASLASGVAFSGNANAIELAENGVGQVLLAPLFLANFGYKTKIAIVNTSNDQAVKAKVVLRSAVASKELLDFLIYLSPSDVWRGEIRSENGKIVLYSADDSIKNDKVPPSGVAVNADGTTFASILPLTQEVPTPAAPDTNAMGHIEIIGLYAVNDSITVGGKSIKIETGMSKFDLAIIFDSSRSALTPVANHSSVDPSWVQLHGNIEMISDNDRMGYRIPALYGTTAPTNPLVIANTVFDADVSAVTGIGFGFGTAGTDNILDIEAAIAATMIGGTYEDDGKTKPNPGINRTNLVVTFPTRYRHFKGNTVAATTTNNPCGVSSVAISDEYTPPFMSDGTIEYGLTAYNNFEQRSTAVGGIFSGLPTSAITNKLVEVNYFIPAWPATSKQSDGVTITAGTKNFESGWFSMSFITKSGCSYAGAPVLSFSHKYKEKTPGAFSQSWLVPTKHN